MLLKQFNEVTQEQVQHCLNVLKEKGDEYVFGEDRLEHFKEAAISQNTHPEQALYSMLSKHLISLQGMCKHSSGCKARWQEKITDSINYLLLLWALVVEEGRR